MPALDPIYILIVATLILLAWVAYQEYRFRRLLAGQNAASLEGTINALAEMVKDTDKVNEEIQQHLLKMETRLQHSIQHVKTVRFNPFPEMGGNHSFVLSLLDEHGDGVVISTLYARDKTSVYAKPVKRRQSEFDLTAEEEQAIKK